ncbi:MAG TPA: endolytic transglycosylase MltG, partial [Microbacterium sp.]|nr:endolytic transglycosylase MltG [Microbacterium sp.]
SAPAASEPSASEPATPPESPASEASASAPPVSARTGATPAPAAPAPSLDALFATEHDADERARIARHQRDRRKSRIAGWVIFAVILAILGGVAAGGFYVWNTYEDKIRAFMGWEEPKDYVDGEATGQVDVTIVSGDTGSSISQTLYDSGVTKTPEAFYDYLIKSGQNPTFQPGVYSLQLKMTSAAALDALLDPANRLENTAQLREGLTVAQSLTILSDSLGIPLEEFQAAVADPSVYGIAVDAAVVAAAGQPLEGWLFPATYTFDPGTTAQQIIQTLVDRTVQSLDAAGVPVDQRQQVLTTASIIQREARLDDDFYKVSRVIANRLAEPMKLQMDSTAQYGYGEMHDGTASSSAEALEDVNPWNTYVIDGLPVGPISNPGDTAIDAAMHPAEGDWLYFVTWNMDTGETIFSATYAEHEQGIAKWNEWCAANDNRGC